MPDIVIKKIKKGGHGGHHGGSWKVAYADFVTAMMAFFLLLWLLSSATEEQLHGISNYFTPETLSQNQSGSGGILGGSSLAVEGALKNEYGSPTVSIDIPPVKTPQELAEARLAEQEEKEFKEAQEQLRIQIEKSPELQGLEKNIRIEETPEGLRIQILDEDGTAMFPSGSSVMADHTRQLLSKVAEVVSGLPQDISIEGHTDAVPYRTANGYSNWELSSDRALATRRELENQGLDTKRFAKVSGLSDTDPLLPEDPKAESNRRISITLLRGTGERPATDGANGATGTSEGGGGTFTGGNSSGGTSQGLPRRPGFSVPDNR